MKFLRCILMLIAAIAPFISYSKVFVEVRDGRLVVDGKPYRFVGVNYWYGPLIAMEDGDRARLFKELDFLKQNGATNLRVMVGVDGISKNRSHLRIPLQTEQGKYNKKALEGLDFFMNEAGKRDMKVVLYLTNNWEWTGGYAQYLAWAEHGSIPYPGKVGWDAYSSYLSKFYDCEECKNAFKAHCKFIIERKNSITGKSYKNDETIMAWEVANEPRPNGIRNTESYFSWLVDVAKFVKSMDGTHLLTTGSEGAMGSEGEINLWKRVHSIPEIDYATIHIWAKNWEWIIPDKMNETFPVAKANMMAYAISHLAIADSLNKPIVIEEIGFPRDNHSFSPLSSVKLRNEYFESLFTLFNKEHKSFQGVNIWAFGGFGQNTQPDYIWKEGDTFLGDPPGEEQGLNSVFAADSSTFSIIKKWNTSLKN